MTEVLDRLTLLELQAALRAGAGPSEALSAAGAGSVLDAAARSARLGRSLTEIAADHATGNASADFLLRCLALSERSGSGGAEAIEHALDAIRDEAELQRLLAVRTAQGRGTALILSAVPAAAWLLLVALDGRMLGFYATPLGWLSAAVAVALSATAWRWMRRLTAATAAAARNADPLCAGPPPPSWGRGLLAAGAVGVPVAAVLGLVAGLLAAAVAGLAVARRRRTDEDTGGAAETVSLVAVALASGMGVAPAFAEVAWVAPPAAVDMLQSAARRLAGGWRCDEALDGTPLAPLGATIAVAQRWGAPAVPALRALADDLRADRRAAVEVAAERLQLALIFPTTLLTLPAFVLGVVPPLLWTTVRG